MIFSCRTVFLIRRLLFTTLSIVSVSIVLCISRRYFCVSAAPFQKYSLPSAVS